MRVDRGDFVVFVTTHALIRAARRGFGWDEIEGVIRTGEFRRLKNGRINIEKQSSSGKVTCVGIIFRPGKMKIITIERNEVWR